MSFDASLPRNKIKNEVWGRTQNNNNVDGYKKYFIINNGFMPFQTLMN